MTEKIALVQFVDEVFSLCVNRVERIIQAPVLYALPHVREGFRGVFILDDEIVPCFDLPQILGVGNHCAFWESQYTLVCMSDLGRVGLPVSRVLQIVDVEAGNLWTASVEEALRGNCRQCFEKSGVRFPLLDPDRLLSLLS